MVASQHIIDQVGLVLLVQQIVHHVHQRLVVLVVKIIGCYLLELVLIVLLIVRIVLIILDVVNVMEGIFWCRGRSVRNVIVVVPLVLRLNRDVIIVGLISILMVVSVWGVRVTVSLASTSRVVQYVRRGSSL